MTQQTPNKPADPRRYPAERACPVCGNPWTQTASGADMGYTARSTMAYSEPSRFGPDRLRMLEYRLVWRCDRCKSKTDADKPAANAEGGSQ